MYADTCKEITGSVQMGNKTLDLQERERIKVMLAEGKTYHAIGKAIERSPHTIKAFAVKPETVQTVEKIKEELSDLFEGLAKKMIKSITDEDIQKINAYQRTVSAGISVDKMRLLREQPTTIIDSLDQVIMRVELKLQKQGLKQQGMEVIDITPNDSKKVTDE